MDHRQGGSALESRLLLPLATCAGIQRKPFRYGAVLRDFRWLGWGREFAFIAWYGVGCVLNFVAAYFALRWLRFTQAGSALGAFVFAFGLPAMAQVGHAQLNYRFCIPLAAVALRSLLVDGRPRMLAVVALLTAWQFFISVYLGVFLVYLLGVQLVVHVFVHRVRLRELPRVMRAQVARLRTHERWFIGATLLVSVLAVGGLLHRYRIIAKAYGLLGGSLEFLASMLPRPQSYLFAWSESARWMQGLLPQVPMQHEHQLFVGFAVFALMGVALARWRRWGTHARLLSVTTLTLAILVVLTLSVGGYSLYLLLASLPGFGALRAPSRVILVMLWPVAILVAAGAQEIMSWARNAAPAIAAGAFMVLAVLLGLETWLIPPYRTPIQTWQERQAAIERLWQGTVRSPEPVLYVSGRQNEPSHLVELDAMIFAQDHRIPTLNGYSGYGPPAYFSLDRCASLETLLQSYANAQRRAVPPSDLERIRKHAVRLALELCPVQVADAPAREVTPSEARALTLEVSDVRLSDSALTFSVTISNAGMNVIDTLSGRGHPLNLAWRIGDDVATGSWQFRRALGFSLAPGESRKVDASGPLPVGSNARRLDVTLVQENVAWLHDLGMPIASASLVAALRTAGSRNAGN